MSGAQSASQGSNDDKASSSAATAVATHSSFYHGNNSSVLLSTAIVFAYDSSFSLKPCRVLLDCGSQANFISRSFLDSLGITSRSSDISISGINNTVTRASQVAQVRLQSRLNTFSAIIDCIVTNQVTDRIPAYTFKGSAFNIPRNIKLADPQFYVSTDVDVLIGADLFWRLLCVGQIKASPEHPMLQKTMFDWVIAGRLGNLSGTAQKIRTFHASVTNTQLHDQLARFWTVEEIKNANNYTIDEAFCEQHFLDNVTRNEQGRYVIKLPFKQFGMEKLGESKSIALKRLYQLERRFERDPVLKSQYSQFLHEYLMLNLMQEASSPDENGLYLPHHCVFEDKCHISKIRVVFDASSKTSTGVALNDVLLTGPVVQRDLMAILMSFRMRRYCFAADIIKMYRQVLVVPSETRFQRILWRENSDSDVKTYELSTVTYGIASASYVTTRCLKHLAKFYRIEYPLGATCVQQDFYIDDLLTGADTINQAKALRDETIQLLRRGGFELSKWASNCPELLKDIGDQAKDAIRINNESTSCVLGTHWNQSDDTFYFSLDDGEGQSAVSKRVMLSEISKLYDPLGLLGPIIVVAKLILQELWQSGTQWDETVPPNVHLRWTRFRDQLPSINHLKVPRCVKPRHEPQWVQLHGFCDASERAYGACVYVRTQSENGDYCSELLCSKSRVAPLKAISLPRLELSAALLLTRLIDKVTEAVGEICSQTFLWSDSEIVLNWISSPSRGWATFIANRTGEIQRLTQAHKWCHVRSVDNPADVLSRGIDAEQIINHALWWHGPSFLELEQKFWPNSNFAELNDIPELKGPSANPVTINESIVELLLNKYSKLSKVCRIIVYVLRLYKTRRPKEPSVFVTPEESTYAIYVICKAIQKLYFSNEYNNKPISSTSNVLSLAPFLDEHGVIRVGGRLKNSGLSPDICHPILLPKDSNLSKRIIEQEHIRTAHGGIQTTMAAVRQRFWPLSLRSSTRKIIKKCVMCFKVKPTIPEVTMGVLPAERMTVSRPFSHVGVDYAGPVMLREGKRNARNSKAYIAIFVYFATKATHVELVSDLTYDAFIGVLKRFVSRRGKPVCIYSDNGTTFVGAKGQLKEFFEFVNSQKTQDNIKHFLYDQEVSWTFIPPNAPHVGGLWEAAIKSTKKHLYRVVGKAHLTFEEMVTILCEIEAILNSRPLIPLSSDPNDLAYLSPGHFLVGAPLTSFPCYDLYDINENRLVCWQRVEQLRQHFWRRWSIEYLHNLQERNKWKKDKGEKLQVGQLVLLKQESLAPLQWSLGRIEHIHAGPDGKVRTATVRTSSGSFMRPVTRIAVLLVDV